MPELPEVEVVRQGLEDFLKLQPTIKKFEFWRKDLRTTIPKQKLLQLVGGRIIAVERRAKYLIFKTTQGDILSHLGMTGSWRVDNSIQKKHDHIRIHLSNGKSLIYNDPRRFGIFTVFDQKKQLQLKDLGPEPLSDDFTTLSLWQSLRSKKTAIKLALMDQRVVVGVGNIYVCEALFLAKISPFVSAQKITRTQALVLVDKIKTVLQKAIALGGSSISDFSSLQSILGSYQDQHIVYGKEGQPCRFCATIIKRKTQSGRSTFWCPECQKKS